MTDYTPPSRATVAAAASDLLADPPPDDGRRAMPRPTWVPLLRRAGWPPEATTLMMPQHEHRGPRAGQRTADTPQPVTVAPETWLVDLARRLGVPVGYAIRGRAGD